MPITLDANLIPTRLTAALDPWQRAAVTSLNGPLLVIAGPGSGKTRVLTYRAAALAAAGVYPRKILAVTFTNKAAAEMRTRIETLTDESTANSMWVSTFHSMCARILRRWHKAVELPSGFTICDAADTKRIMKAAASEEGLLVDYDPKEAISFLNDAARLISSAKNAGYLNPDKWTPPVGKKEVVDIWKAYTARMKASGCVDFDDLLLLTVTLGENEEARHWLATRFDRVLVDEFQDTNVIQQQLVELLAPHGQVCAVGDPDQSIYGFRGATGAVADMFANSWPEHETVVLEKNYRSTSTICTTVSAIISVNEAKHRSNLVATNDEGVKVRIHAAATVEDEADWVCSQIRANARPGLTQAVLVRANYQTRPLERSLTDYGVAHAVVGALRFADRAEIKDALAWLRLVTNPLDIEAYNRAIAAPRRGVGEKTVKLVTDYALANKTDLITASRNISSTGKGRAKAGLENFADMLDALTAVDKEGNTEKLVRMVLETAGVRAYVAAIPGEPEKILEKLENLDDLLATAVRLDATIKNDPSGELPSSVAAVFTERLALVSASESSTGSDPDADGIVVISTIHAAKGKEYDNVYVVGCEEDVIPHARSTNSAEEIAEERRLLFVACSRAKQQLYLTRAVERWSPANGAAENSPSRFLADIPPSLVHASRQSSVLDKKPLPQNNSKTSYKAKQSSHVWSGTPMRSTPKSPPTFRSTREPVRTVQPVKAEVPDWQIGGNAEHKIFGIGQVTIVKDGMVSVLFEDGNIRTFAANGTHLTPLT